MRPGKLRKIVLAAGAAWLVLLAVAGFFLYRGISRFQTSESELNAARGELDNLYARNPFPSPPNVVQETTNLVLLKQQFNAFLTGLGQGQPDMVKQTPAAFMGSFWQTQKELLRQAKASAVVVPGDFKFGFAAYGSGELPVADDVPGLTLQLSIVTNLCAMLYDSRINELIRVEREPFDAASGRGAGSAAGVSRRGPPPPPGPVAPGAGNVNIGVVPAGALYTGLHFTLEFRATEDAVVAALNRLARSPLFVVVTDLQLSSGDAGVVHTVKPASREAAAAPEDRSAKTKPRTQTETQSAKGDRIVSGQEKPMSVKLELDVYRFGKGTDA